MSHGSGQRNVTSCGACLGTGAIVVAPQVSRQCAPCDGRGYTITPSTRVAPITHVAIIFRGEVFSLPKPCRHHHVLQTINRALALYGLSPVDDSATGKDQGFVDEDGLFLDREQAWERACATGQRIGESVCPGTLFSEDLW